MSMKIEMNRYSEWDSVNFNLHKEEVRSFLISSVNYWIEYFHVDGIRFDAVSNIIYYKGRKTMVSMKVHLIILKDQIISLLKPIHQLC